jgi:glycosyltransferase involved in cell wall biosynthesis
MRSELEQAIARHDLTDRIRITGWANGTRVREEIAAARALVLPSFAEGLPVVIMEALALGRPVIATYVAGVPELVAPSCGWIVPPGSVSALVDVMREALTLPPEDLDRLAEEGMRRVRALHDVRSSALTLSLLVKEVAA